MTYQHILITGGAGFIGTNAAKYFLKQGKRVTLLDNFSRAGSTANAAWLKKHTRGRLSIIRHDIRDNTKQLHTALRNADLILHLAGQVAVTTSIVNPREDFEINALGTLNLLETMRQHNPRATLIYASTNKVYGNLETVPTKETVKRYVFTRLPHGITESQPLDFHSPYGCSKGAADQYVRDYHRIYGLNTIVFRQSCIYGQHQHGQEDQGWLAWLMLAAHHNQPITIYGNGKQVRDVLYVDDLVRAYDLAASCIENTRGQIYNIGGGANNTLAVWTEFGPMIEKLFGKHITVRFAAPRPGDQNIYISDIRKAHTDFGWKPTTSIAQGLQALYRWVLQT